MDKFSDYMGYLLVASVAVTFLGQASNFSANASLYKPIAKGDLAVELIVHKPVPLTNDTIREDWNYFSTAAYFGAFAYNASEQTYNYYKDVSSIEQAKSAALSLCGAESRMPSGCKIYAELHPKVESTILPRRLAKTAEIDFIEEYLKGAERWSHGAFAMNAHSEYGWATGHTTVAKAREVAMRYCEQISAERRAEVDGYNIRNFIQPDAWKCAVIHDN